MCCASVAVGVVFTWVYTPQLGLLALIFGFFGATAPAVLSDEHFVTFAIVIAALWPQIAFCMVLYLAGLNNLSEELIGAGRVDGARGWNMLRHIVLPQLTQVTFIAIAVTVVGALRSFDMVSVMTRGGPFGSSEVLAYQMFEQSIFSYRFGYGAAIASVLFVIMAVFIVWYLYPHHPHRRKGSLMYPRPIPEDAIWRRRFYFIAVLAILILWLCPLFAIILDIVPFDAGRHGRQSLGLADAVRPDRQLYRGLHPDTDGALLPEQPDDHHPRRYPACLSSAHSLASSWRAIAFRAT